jgi:hypothetical protein
MGGLEQFELNTFLAAQKCALFQRALELNEKCNIPLVLTSISLVAKIHKSLIDSSETPVFFTVL